MEWRDATRSMISQFLRNPAYAGICAYGRTAVDHSRPPSPQGRPRRIVLPLSAQVWKEGSQEPYVEPQLWPEIQRRLDSNKHSRKIPPGTGEALLQGLLRCATHQTSFETFYDRRVRRGNVIKRIPAYRCSAKTHELGIRCSQVLARVVDEVFTTELLKVPFRLTVEDIEAAAQREMRDFEHLVRQREDQRRRSKQRIADLERERDQVSLDQHPHYRRRLCDQIEKALEEDRDLEARLRRNPLTPPLTMSDSQLKLVGSLLNDLPRLWRLPNVTQHERKRFVRIVVDRVLVTPDPGAWTLEVCWVGGERTLLKIPSHRGVLDVLRIAYGEGYTEAEISALLNEHGFVRRAGALAGTPFDEHAVRRWVSKLDLQAPFVEAARSLIAVRVEEGARMSAIADELDAKGIRHRRGKWTRGRIGSAITRLRRRGIIPPAAARPDLRILALHENGLRPREIVAQLRREGATTRGRRLMTREVVYGALRRLGHQPNSLAASAHARQLLETWVGTCTTHEMASRLNSLGVRTFRGQPWTEKIVRLRLEQLGLTKYAHDLLNELLRQWSGVFTLPDLVHRLNSLTIRTPRGHAWTEEYVRRHLALLGLGYRRRRAKPAREPKPTRHGAGPYESRSGIDGEGDR